MKIVVVGGVAAGASAAAKARRVNEDAEIVIFEKGPYVSFANCGLLYHVSGDIKEKKDLLLVTPEEFHKNFNIDVRINHEVVDIDVDNKLVIVDNGDEIIYEEYDKLILATGSKPKKLPIPGVDLPGVYNIFTINDMEYIKEYLADVENAVVIGGGYIGIETAEALLKKGIQTTLVELEPQLVPNFDPEFSIPVEKHLREKGLEIILNKSAKSIKGAGKVEEVELSDGTILKADIVIVSIGSTPQLELAEKSGLAIGETGGVLVDATMLTSNPDIYAAGDIVESVHLVSRKKVRIPLAGSANKQGRVAGANAAGGKMLFKGVLGTSVIKAFDLTLASTGLNEKQAKKLNKNYFVCYSPSQHHVDYYPGAKWMICKLIVEDITGNILGAQIVGFEGVDKRIDVFSTAIYSNLTVFDLENLDLAYAPPYGSPKDPVILLGMIASNVIRGETKIVTPWEFEKIRQQEDVIILDSRPKVAYIMDHIEGAISMPLSEIRERYKELDPNKKIFVYCMVGNNSYKACRILTQKGFDAYNVTGGIMTYKMKV
jgi:NADPH-dependent 2,4-dienoyl-CoA reductase/sulfur reductase-like enzyme/rhodanese-related sulfurtransferase